MKLCGLSITCIQKETRQYVSRSDFRQGQACSTSSNVVNPNQPGLFWRLSCPGGGGGAALLQISAVDRAIATKICIKVECDVNYKTELLDYSLLLSFILYELIMLIYAKKSYFHYKSLIKASRLLIFGTYILFNILSNSALKNFSIEINFLCILLFYEFLINVFLCFFNLLFFIVFSLKFVAATF